MSKVILKNVKKIYPIVENEKKALKKKKKAVAVDESGKANLQVIEGIGVVAVQEFNIEIQDKEFVVLVGPSGCGKSTTLRMIAGLEEITDGDLYIGDVKMNNIAPRDRDIAMVFQNYALYPHMTVYDNMAFGLKIRKTNKDDIDRKVKEAAEILGITDYLYRKPKALSGGQRQRVAIGRAIVRNPQVFLMDEPLSNLDAKLRNQMRAEIIKLHKRLDTTFIYVTHDQTEAMTLGDRIVVMKDGFIQQIGTPDEVFNKPSNVFVASFIGTPQMNLFDAKIEKTQFGWVLKVRGAVIALSTETSAILDEKYDGTCVDVIAGIRPEHMSISDSPDGAISGIVDVCEMMGSSIHVHVDVNGQHVILVFATTDLSDAYKNGFTSGEEIFFTADNKLIHLFDKDTENNIIY